MADTSTDDQFLQRALALARQGIGLAAPNPCVGAVVVDPDGNIAGSGSHTYDGLKHAEVLALEEAGAHARNATLYINLEPCSHHGRTPPCTEAVIAAGIKRVVAAMADPNPVVSGRGFERLRNTGIEVEVGLRQEEARNLNESFTRYIRHGVPLVTLKAAMTLDGKIAPPPTDALRTEGTPAGGWITSDVARAHVQELRHQSDALMVGVGTILSDNPLLTDRSGRPRRRPLLRVILDSRLRLPAESRLTQNTPAGGRVEDVLVFYSAADEMKKAQLEERGIRVEQLPASLPDGRPDMAAILRRLGELEITNLMIEGGATVNWTALAAGIVDKVFLYYAPKILAGTGSIPFAAGAGFHRMSEAVQVKSLRLHRFGDDFAVEGYLRDPYAE